MRKIYLDISPAYLLFSVQCSDADGAAIAPTADALRVYEIDGTSATVGGTAITGSPFDPVQFGTETGLWGAKIAQTSFTAGTQYLFVWAMTVDGVAAQKQEAYAACNAADFMADVSGVSTFDPAADTVTTGSAAQITAIEAVADRLAALLEDTGDYERFLATALEAAPTDAAEVKLILAGKTGKIFGIPG